MRRGIGIVAVVVVILAGIGIGVGAYNAGERNGIAQGIEQVQVFPGFFLFPLFLIGAFFLIGGIMRGAGRWGRGGPGGYGPGPWNEEGRRRFEERAREWHQREHGDTPPAEASPAG